MNPRTSSASLSRCNTTRARGGRPGRTILARSIAPLGLLLACASGPVALADGIFAPNDPILGGQLDTGTSLFNIGVSGGGGNTWPGAESPDHAIDGVAQKYLNFGKTDTGFLVNPTFNGGAGSVVNSIQLWTANDAVERDPSSYIIYGTNSNLDFNATSFDLSLFTQVSAGDLALPAGRNSNGGNPLNDTLSQTVTFPNTSSFKEYLIIFPTVKDANAANSMQIGEVQLFGVGSFQSLTWKGTNNSTWNIATTSNWDSGGTSTTYNDGSGVLFDDTSVANRNVITIAGTGGVVKPAAVTFQNSLVNYTLNGDAITSTGSFLKTGTGSVTLNNANSYGSGITINGGTVTIGATGSVGTSSVAVNNTTAAGGPVVLNFSSPQSIGSLSGTVLTPGTNVATVNLNGALTINQAVSATFQGNIAGTGGVTKAGPGTLTLTGTNTYAGPTVVSGGILQSAAPGDNAQGALPAGQPVTVSNGAVLAFGADDGVGYYAGSVSGVTVNDSTIFSVPDTHSTLPAVTLNGGAISAANAGNISGTIPVNYILDGDVTTVASSKPSKIDATAVRLRHDQQNTGTSTPTTFNVARGTSPVDLEVSSVVQDLGAGLIKSGAGVLSLSNKNVYTGPTVVNAGTILVRNSSALGTGTVTLNNGGKLSFGMALALNGFNDLTLNGGATIDSSGSVLTLTDNAGNEARSAYTPTAIDVSKGFTTDFVYTSGGNRAADGVAFVIQNNDATQIGGGGGGLAYQGVLNSIAYELNIYTGGGQPIGSTVGVQGATGGYTPSAPVNLASGRPIYVHLVYDYIALSLTETLTDPLGQTTYTNTFDNIDLASNIGGTTAFVGFSGATGGASSTQTIGNFSFNNFSQGPAIANDISVAAGGAVGLDVVPPSAGGFGSATLKGKLTLNAGATVNVTGGAAATNSPFRIDVTGATSIAGNSIFDVANNGTGKGVLSVQAITESGGAATLTKSGTGTLVIGGSATYTGTTTVNAGSLVVNGSLTGSVTTVNTGGTLGGTGTVGTVTVAGGGALSPGDNGVGTLTSSSLTLQANSSFLIDIGATTGDQVKAATASITGNIPLVLSLVADPTDNTLFTIVDGTSVLGGVAGGARFTFNGTPLNEGSTFFVASGAFNQSFKISYAADSGNDVTLLAIPEPGSASMLLSAAAGLIGLRRRRQEPI